VADWQWQPRCRTLFVDGGAPVDMTWDWEWDLHGCLFHAGAANFPQQHRFHQKAKKEKEKKHLRLLRMLHFPVRLSIRE
jgi:hypothetical protein